MRSNAAVGAFFLIGAVFFLFLGAMLEESLFWTGLFTLVFLGAIVLFKARS
jgi:hypothetical protein